LIDRALRSLRHLGRHREDHLDHDVALRYVLRCSPSNPEIADWVRETLSQNRAFGIRNHWELIVPFVQEYPDIRRSMLRQIISDPHGSHLYEFDDVVEAVRGEEVRDYLIAVARTTPGFGQYWAIKPLLRVWGKEDPIAKTFLEEIPSWDDDRLNNLAALLPELMDDRAACRARLLSLCASVEHPRFDMISRGLISLGCGASDIEVVDTLLKHVSEGAPAFDPGIALIKHFSAAPKVRSYAKQTLRGHSTPLDALARVYEGDQELRPLVLRSTNSLPSALRGELAEVSAVEARSRPAFRELLTDYDVEVDGELKITSSIYYHRGLINSSFERSMGDPQRRLRDALMAVGPDMEERRAAAFAGMVVENRLGELASMLLTQDSHGSFQISVGSGFAEDSERVAALICENWEPLNRHLGSVLFERLGRQGTDESALWDKLAPYVHTSEPARMDFLTYCNTTHSLGLRSLLALAQERPSSLLLLEHCLRAFNPPETGGPPIGSAWAVQQMGLEASYLLRDHFPRKAEVLEELQAAFRLQAQQIEAVALVLYQPSDPLLDSLPSPKAIWDRYSDRVAALHLASARSEPQEFTELLMNVINRPIVTNIWDFQDLTNRAVLARLRRDSDVTQRVRDTLLGTPTASELASLPRYLLAAGAFDTALRERCSQLLQEESGRTMPRAGYDAVENQVRAISQSLLDVLAPSFST
jgi:hypothetical protein